MSSFFYHDPCNEHEIAEATYQWNAGDIVESEGLKYRLLSAKCVYRWGQGRMEWVARVETGCSNHV